MDKTKQNSIEIAVSQPDDIRGGFSQLATVLLFALGLGGIASDFFPTVIGSAIGAFAVLFVTSCAVLLLLNTRFSQWVLPGGAAAAAIFALLLHSPLRDGMCVMINDILTSLISKDGKIYLLFETESISHGVFAATFLGIFAAFLFAAGRIPALIPVIFVVAVTAAGIIAPGWALLLFLCASVLRILGGDIGERMTHAVPAVLISLVFAFGLCIAVGNSADALPDAVADALHALRYDSKTNSMPEGKLKNLSAWEKSDTPALTVTMETPQKLYLRGMTGEEYTGTEWMELSAEKKATWADKFYWLHKDGFYSLSGIATAENITAGIEAEKMTIENLSACREHAYLPYALADNSLLDTTRIGDSEAPGVAVETITYIPGSVPQWFESQAQLAARQDEKTIKTYLANEEIYREWAENEYTEISDTTAAAIERALSLEKSEEELTLSQIKDIILETLEEKITYDESAVSYHTHGDFVTYVLESSAHGYSVHYATCAVMMLRYFGVPARYVEGYFISADDAAGYKSGEEITLTEENAHAWAEYYLDGVGWIPFETTPGYIDDEELAVGAAESAAVHYYRKTEPQVTENIPDETIFDGEGVSRDFRVSARVVFVVLGISAILLLLLWVIWQRKRLRRALSEIDKADNRNAIAALYGYAAALEKYAHQSMCVSNADAAAALNREALFSAHDMTNKQRESMQAYVNEVLSMCKASWNFPKRIFYRFLNAIYL